MLIMKTLHSCGAGQYGKNLITIISSILISQYIICWQFAEYPDNDRSLKKPEGSFVKL